MFFQKLFLRFWNYFISQGNMIAHLQRSVPTQIRNSYTLQNPESKFTDVNAYSSNSWCENRMGEKSIEWRPSLSSRWRAELEDLSLLEGRELAAIELVAWSCISPSKQTQTRVRGEGEGERGGEQLRYFSVFRQRKRAGYIGKLHLSP